MGLRCIGPAMAVSSLFGYTDILFKQLSAFINLNPERTPLLLVLAPAMQSSIPSTTGAVLFTEFR